MKKLVFLLLVLCLSLTACSKKEEVIDGPGSTWDCVEYTNIEDMNAAAKTNIVTAPVAGKSDEWFGVISNSIAQYKFTVNGEEWCVRASKDVDNDISGLNYENIGFEKDITATYYNDDVYAFRFFYDDTQYVIFVDVKDKDIAMSHFDDVCGEFKTNITGIKSGYDNRIYEDGNNVIYELIMYNDDGTKTISETTYVFENDKMVKILNCNTFDSEQAAKEYYDLLIEYGRSPEEITLDGITISSENDDVDFYSDYTKAEFIEMMQQSMAQ